MTGIKEKINKGSVELKKTSGHDNVWALPRLQKVVVSTGVGKIKGDKKRVEFITDRLTRITGQKPALRGAKKSIASFKLRQGDIVGLAVTLRGLRMYGFLDRFFNAAVPRIRDFRGFDAKAIDNMGNLTIGIKEHTIFPETADEDIKDVFGLSVTLTTSARTPKEARALFDLIGVPFKK